MSNQCLKSLNPFEAFALPNDIELVTNVITTFDWFEQNWMSY